MAESTNPQQSPVRAMGPILSMDHAIAITPTRDTRPKLIKALEMLKNKVDHLPPKKHGNIPL